MHEIPTLVLATVTVGFSLLGIQTFGDEPVPRAAGSESEETEAVSLCEYWPFAIGNSWKTLGVFDGGERITIIDSFTINDHQIWGFELSEARASGVDVVTVEYRVYVDDLLYATPNLDDLDTLPAIVGDMEALFSQTIPIDVPFTISVKPGIVDGGETTYTAIRGSLSDITGDPLLPLDTYPLGDQPDVIAIIRESGETVAMFARDLGPLRLVTGRFVATTINGGCNLGAGEPEMRFVEAQFDGQNGVEGMDGPTGVAVSPDGSHVYVAAAGPGAVVVFSRDSDTGRLQFVEAEVEGFDVEDDLDRPRDLVISPDGAFVYVTASTANSLNVFSRDQQSGNLTWVERHISGVDGVQGLDGAFGIAVASTGGFVCVAGTDDHSLAIFSRDTASGTLTFRDAEFGDNTEFGPLGVEISPDGNFVYAGGMSENSISVYRIDPVSYTLSLLEMHTNGENGVMGIGNVVELGISADGAHVYALGSSEEAIAIFNRDADTGSLTFDNYRQGLTTDEHRFFVPFHIAVSPTGLHVLMTGLESNGLIVYKRDPDSGNLTYAGRFWDDTDGVDGLLGAWDVVISPDGKHAYIAGLRDDAIAVFALGSQTVSEPEGEGDSEGGAEGEGDSGDGDGEVDGEGDGGQPDGETQEGLSEGEVPTEGTSEGAIDGDGEDTGCAFTIDSSLSPPKSRSADPGVWLPLLAACVWLHARGRFARR